MTPGRDRPARRWRRRWTRAGGTSHPGAARRSGGRRVCSCRGTSSPPRCDPLPPRRPRHPATVKVTGTPSRWRRSSCWFVCTPTTVKTIARTASVASTIPITTWPTRRASTWTPAPRSWPMRSAGSPLPAGSRGVAVAGRRAGRRWSLRSGDRSGGAARPPNATGAPVARCLGPVELP